MSVTHHIHLSCDDCGREQMFDRPGGKRAARKYAEEELGWVVGINTRILPSQYDIKSDLCPHCSDTILKGALCRR